MFHMIEDGTIICTSLRAKLGGMSWNSNELCVKCPANVKRVRNPWGPEASSSAVSIIITNYQRRLKFLHSYKRVSVLCPRMQITTRFAASRQGVNLVFGQWFWIIFFYFFLLSTLLGFLSTFRPTAGFVKFRSVLIPPLSCVERGLWWNLVPNCSVDIKAVLQSLRFQIFTLGKRIQFY